MYHNIHGLSESNLPDLSAIDAQEAALRADAELAAMLPASASLMDELRAEAGAALIALGNRIKPRTLGEGYQMAQLRQSGNN